MKTNLKLLSLLLVLALLVVTNPAAESKAASPGVNRPPAAAKQALAPIRGTCGQDWIGVSQTQVQTWTNWVYLPLVLGLPLPPIPGEKITNGALDLTRIGDQSVDAATAQTALEVLGFTLPKPTAGPGLPIAKGTNLREWMASIIQATANAVPDGGVPSRTMPATLSSVTPQGFEGISFGADPNESYLAYKRASDGKWVVPPGGWATWWIQGSFQKWLNGNVLVQGPGGAKLFVGFVDLDNGQYFGSNWEFQTYGGFMYAWTQLGWFDYPEGRSAITMANQGSGELVVHSLYGVTDNQPPPGQAPWEPTYKGYESGYRVCAWSDPQEIAHWHCRPRENFLIPGWGDKVIDGELRWLSQSEFDRYLPTPESPLGTSQTASPPSILQAGTAVLVPVVVTVIVVAGVVYLVVSVETDGFQHPIYLPIDLDSFGQPPNLGPVGVRLIDTYIIGMMIGTTAMYYQVRSDAFTAYHEWYLEGPGRDRVALYPEPPALLYPILEELDIPMTNVQVDALVQGFPDPRNFCQNKYNFRQYDQFLEWGVDHSVQPEMVIVQLRENGTITARMILSWEDEGIMSWVEVRPSFRGGGRATYLIIMSQFIMAQYLKDSGQSQILTKPHVFVNLNAYKYTCYIEYMKALAIDGAVTLAIAGRDLLIYLSKLAR